jgi:hypothetical protein
MRPDQRNVHGVSAGRQPLAVFTVAAVTLLLLLVVTSEVWARSSGGRYGGRSGFAQARRGFEGEQHSPSTMPSRHYSSRAALDYRVPTPSPGYPVPIPIPIPSP